MNSVHKGGVMRGSGGGVWGACMAGRAYVAGRVCMAGGMHGGETYVAGVCVWRGGGGREDWTYLFLTREMTF